MEHPLGGGAGFLGGDGREVAIPGGCGEEVVACVARMHAVGVPECVDRCPPLLHLLDHAEHGVAKPGAVGG